MRFQGRITSWKDDKGFGFITPNGGGKQVFVHVSAFRNRQRRPDGDELVTYELAADEKGRGQAMQVAFVGEPARGDGKLVPAWLPTFFTAGFLAFLSAAVMTGKLPLAIPGVYLVASVMAYVTYAIDKSAAVNNQWRIAENTLHIDRRMAGCPGRPKNVPPQIEQAILPGHVLGDRRAQLQRARLAAHGLGKCSTPRRPRIA